LSSTTQIFNDSVDAYASWTLFLSFVSILILISGVVLLTHKKPEPSTTQRDGGIPLNAIPGRRVPRTGRDKTEGHDEMHPEDRGEDGQALWDVGEASDEEDEGTTLAPRLEESGGKGSYGEEGEHLMTASLDDNDTHTHTTTTNGRQHTRRRSSSSILHRDQDRDDGDGFGAFSAA
jgi:magnesium transporter